jgi:hypothetical protein
MDIKIVIASLVALSVVGAGGYVVVSTNVAVEVNQPGDEAEQPVLADDFRDLIPGYETLSLSEKATAIREVLDGLNAEQKVAANRELTALAKEVNRRAREGLGKSDSPGYTPPGWED